MELLATREFNGVTLQCYSDEIDSSDFWATREQIGQLLEYAFPVEAIGKLHNRNKDRKEEFINNPDFIIRLCEAIKAEREKSAVLKAKIEEDKPKVIFTDSVATSKESILIGSLAKIYGIRIGQNKLFWTGAFHYETR